MGIGLVPVFKPCLRAVQYDCEGVSLLHEYETLDRLALAKGLTPLSGFGDNRSVPEGFDGGPDELDELLGPWDEWFPASEGLRTVEGLVETIKSNPKAIRKLKEPEYVLEELEELARCLRIAEKKKAQFRLEVFS